MSSEIKPELAERMAKLVRQMAMQWGFGTDGLRPEHYHEAIAIVAELPVPVDPDVWLARDICHAQIVADPYALKFEKQGAYLDGQLDGSFSMRCALAAIKRIRAERGE